MKKKYLILPVLLLCMLFLVGCNKGGDKATLTENTDYTIDNTYPVNNMDLTKRGYYIDSLNEPDAPYFYIISLGNKSVEMYTLKIKEVTRVNDKTEIVVEEVAPTQEQMAQEGFKYQAIVVKFPKYQENITIKNTTGEEYKLLES